MLYRHHFQGQLQVLAGHGVANFTVQHLIAAAPCKMVNEWWDCGNWLGVSGRVGSYEGRGCRSIGWEVGGAWGCLRGRKEVGYLSPTLLFLSPFPAGEGAGRAGPSLGGGSGLWAPWGAHGPAESLPAAWCPPAGGAADGPRGESLDLCPSCACLPPSSWILPLTPFSTPPQAFHCWDPPARQDFCAPLLASLQTYEAYYPSEEGLGATEQQVTGVGVVVSLSRYCVGGGYNATTQLAGSSGGPR